MHGGVSVSTCLIATIVIVAVTAYIYLHSCVSNGRQSLMLISHTTSYIEMISLRLRRCRFKHHPALVAVMWAYSIQLVNIWKHPTPEVAALILQCHALIAGAWYGTVLRVLCLHDGVHILVINGHTATRCPLPIAWVHVASLTGLSHRGQHLLLWSLRMLGPLFNWVLGEMGLLPVFFIFCHLFNNGCLCGIVETSLGIWVVLLHRHHLLLGILLLHHIRVLVGVIGILIHHLVRILTILLGWLHILVVVLRELELSTCISRGERLHWW